VPSRVPILVSIAYSPWSRRVKRALDRMGTPYRLENYVTTLSEPWLRVRLGRPLGRITVPVLLGAVEGPIVGGLDIVRWASARAREPLIPGDLEAPIAEWTARADRLMEAGRVRTARRVVPDAVAIAESLPPSLRWMGPVGRMVGREVARHLIRKYGDGRSDDALKDDMRAVLEETRAALGGRATLLDRFSFADIALAESLTFVSPPERIPLGPRSRVLWTEPDLASEFADLLAWRDAVSSRPGA
jgi:glutathione S-transferase